MENLVDNDLVVRKLETNEKQQKTVTLDLDELHPDSRKKLDPQEDIETHATIPGPEIRAADLKIRLK